MNFNEFVETVALELPKYLGEEYKNAAINRVEKPFVKVQLINVNR